MIGLITLLIALSNATIYRSGLNEIYETDGPCYIDTAVLNGENPTYKTVSVGKNDEDKDALVFKYYTDKECKEIYKKEGKDEQYVSVDSQTLDKYTVLDRLPTVMWNADQYVSDPAVECKNVENAVYFDYEAIAYMEDTTEARIIDNYVYMVTLMDGEVIAQQKIAKCDACNTKGQDDCEGENGYYKCNAAPAPVTCPDGCVCDDGSSVCKSCSDSTKEVVNNACVAKCSSNQYRDNNGACQACHTSCATCTGPAETECASCTWPKVLNDQTHKCEDPAPVTCAVEHCTTCVSGKSDECQTCASGYTPSQDKKSCVEDAPTPAAECKVDSESHCSKCHECKTSCLCCEEGYAKSWSDTIKCSVCDTLNGYYMLNNKCVKCEAEHCSVCDSSDNKKCTTCESGYIAKDGQCKQCDPNCRSCLVNGEGKCDTNSCDEKYYLAEGNTCAKCVEDHCRECSGAGAATCTRCKEGYVLKEGKCKDCADKCLVCTVNGKEKCDTDGCKEKYYTTAEYKCEKCEDDHCLKCTGAGQAKCTRCEEGYLLENSKCTEEAVCKIENTDQCGVKSGYTTYYVNDRCVANVGSGSYKISGGVKCSYTDSACQNKVKEYKYLDVTDNCIRLKDKLNENEPKKYYKMKKVEKCQTPEPVKEYLTEDCSGEGTTTFSSICRKVESGEYEDKYVKTPASSTLFPTYNAQFPLYSDASCTQQIEKGDAKCVSMGCSGNGSVMNVIIVAILIISFMI